MDRPANSTPLRGILLKIASVCVFVGMASLIKATARVVPPGEAVFFRAFFALPVILIWLGTTGGLRSGLSTRNPLGHFWRGLVGTSAMGFGFAGLGLLPLPEVTAIGYAAPILTVAFAAMFLGEEVRAFRILTVALGMVGVLIILSPRLTAFSDDGLGSQERKLVNEETTSAIVFWFSVSAAALSLVTLPFGWTMPDAGSAAMLVAAGFLGGLGQVLLTSSYRHADASLIAPFEYASMLLALGVGYFVFSEVPGRVVLIGAAIVVTAGILIIWRERQLGLERARQRRSMTPQG
jgi:drug/metabolite transporter (DMT)-like permease